ncbi:MAG: hypothetical protein Tsb0021_16590 [Chlamydiales bacterium]
MNQIPTDNKYILQTGSKGQERLVILNKFYNTQTIGSLRTIEKLHKVKTVLEVGCGIGHLACCVAKLFENSVSVYGIDISDE